MLSFWWKRLWRIYPIYWVATALWLALLLASPTAGRAERDVVHVAMSFALLPERLDPVLSVGWSLRHELLFYGLFGLLLWRRWLGVAVLSLWAAGIVWNMASLMTGGPAFFGEAGYLVFRGFNLEFFFGLAASALVRRGVGGRPGPVLAMACGAALFVAAAVVEVGFGPWPIEYPPLRMSYAVGAALMLYGLAAFDRAGRWHVPDWAVAVGGASYSIYLVHVLVATLGAFGLRLVRRVVWIPLEVSFVVLLVAAVLGGMVLHRVAERPLLRWGGLWGRGLGFSAAARAWLEVPPFLIC